MQTWRCPHCGTPQAESSRCWVCKRSSTTCATCRHFRRSIAGGLGYCGLEPRRLPLTGEELRGCWQGSPDAAEPVVTPTLRSAVAAARPRLEFVPLDVTTAASEAAGRESPAAPAAVEGGAEPPPARAPTADPLAGFWADD